MNTRGFTLIELLIVVAIIGILAAIAVPNFLNAQVRAKIGRAVSDLKSIETALEMYKMDTGDYPPWSRARAPGSGDFTHPNEIRLYRLTTPIAYITSVPRDPFFSQTSEDAAQWGSAYDFVNVSPGGDFNWDCLWGAWWRLNSWGPDSRNDWGGCRATRTGRAGNFGCTGGGPNFLYQSTNGLNSDGDIVWLGARTGRRTSPPCNFTNGV